MVFQIAGLIIFPIVMMTILGPPPEHLFTEEPEQTPQEDSNLIFAFFLMWFIWILIMIRVVYQKRQGTYRFRRGF